MASTVSPINPYTPLSAIPSSSPSPKSLSPLSNYLSRFSKWRAELGLPNPGSVENLQKEVKATHLTNYAFDGGRADLTKSMSMSPLFQVTHSFALGSQTMAPSYNFGAMYATENVFLQGGVDHDGNVSARVNQGWANGHVSKAQAQLSQTPGHNLLQLEQDFSGQDFNVNLKAVNPWPSDLTGIFVGSYLQSLTKNFACGTEMVFQRPTPSTAELVATYLAKYTSSDKSWIATAQLQPAGILQATYWHKLSEKVDFAADLQLVATPMRRDAVATLGAKFDLRLSTFRAQLDSTGKVSALLEQRFTPTFAFLMSGEIDHLKNSAKVGVGVMIESSALSPEEMEMQMQQMQMQQSLTSPP
ncbi:eukaryotic porin-domain-containing protein [Lentinula edodes]|uniref:Mitochondrial import receptor subunit tom40 n=1 Tax=Lentinula edodes TaxID=5353 RepID=A0A1Q3ET14_LENED|nr:eukaryotic porin-domain-containing protein [Lentinula edodes]GAW10329.1 mitochondrial import receptor subunit tom40 [Lentinula edodes]